MWEIFTQFPKVLEKNKHAFGNLFEAINYYMVVGKQQLCETPENIKVICQMANVALFTDMPNKTINNTEGAMLLQLLFQVMTGSEALNQIMVELLERVQQRMEDDKIPIHLKKHILGIFMSAMHYNSAFTLQYLESKQMTAALLQELFKSKEHFKHEYEKRLFIIGLSRMLQCMDLPASLGPVLFEILNQLIDMLTSLHD